jgi:hypothetical protein
MSLDLDQLKGSTVPGFGALSEELYAAVRRAADALRGLGDLPTEEETDQRFVIGWLIPRRDEMIALTNDLAGAYGDIGEVLHEMKGTVEQADWGIADSLREVPDYSQAAAREGR